uniref:Uncharacterized protein n=1 Tax=Cacopsylla melanoneura TaxID=428564 RepID=A0A8D9E941_9HEMI
MVYLPTYRGIYSYDTADRNLKLPPYIPTIPTIHTDKKIMVRTFNCPMSGYLLACSFLVIMKMEQILTSFITCTQPRIVAEKKINNIFLLLSDKESENGHKIKNNKKVNGNDNGKNSTYFTAIDHKKFIARRG